MGGLLTYAALGAVEGGARAAERGWREQAAEARKQALYEKNRDEKRAYDQTIYERNQQDAYNKQVQDDVRDSIKKEEERAYQREQSEIDRKNRIADSIMAINMNQQAKVGLPVAWDKDGNITEDYSKATHVGLKKGINFGADGKPADWIFTDRKAYSDMSPMELEYWKKNFEFGLVAPDLYLDKDKKPLAGPEGAVYRQKQRITGVDPKTGVATGYEPIGKLELFSPKTEKPKPYYEFTYEYDGEKTPGYVDEAGRSWLLNPSSGRFDNMEEMLSARQNQIKQRKEDINQIAQTDLPQARGMALHDVITLANSVQPDKLGKSLRESNKVFSGLNIDANKFHRDWKANAKKIETFLDHPSRKKYEELAGISEDMKDYVHYRLWQRNLTIPEKSVPPSVVPKVITSNPSGGHASPPSLPNYGQGNVSGLLSGYLGTLPKGPGAAKDEYDQRYKPYLSQ